LARLYSDHNVSHYIGPLLWTLGHDLVFSRDIGATSLTDDALLLSTVRANRMFITHNRKDFRMLHDAWVTWPVAFGMALPPHPGILILDQAPPETLARVLADFLDVTSPEQLANAIFWWHRHDGWRQPIAGASWEPYQPLSEPGQE
jgi:Domain of unknown function (DUF5615)